MTGTVPPYIGQPLKRRAYRRNEDGAPMVNGLGVSIDITDIKFS